MAESGLRRRLAHAHAVLTRIDGSLLPWERRRELAFLRASCRDAIRRLEHAGAHDLHAGDDVESFLLRVQRFAAATIVEFERSLEVQPRGSD